MTAGVAGSAGEGKGAIITEALSLSKGVAQY